MLRRVSFLALCWLLAAGLAGFAPPPQAPDPQPPSSPVKLIFIHHSTGGNWLADPEGNELGGGLGRSLMENNYYVSATNYGWGPDSIGDATDIPNWLDWFRSERSPQILQALYTENGQNFGDFGAWPRLAEDPGGENQVILFKSCFPNSDLEGSPNDPPAPEGWLSVSNAKYVYNQLLEYFATRPDKLFVVITAPPLSSRQHSANARAFNLWLVNDWLEENHYTLNNVAVFDFYNVLTGPDSHHRMADGKIEHTVMPGRDTLYYPSGDDHPARAGNLKATQEFVPLLNVFYNRWKAEAPAAPPLPTVPAEPAPGTPPAASPESPPAAGGGGVFFEDFEGGAPGWEAFDDGGGKTLMACAASGERAFSGKQSLKIDYDIAAEGWGTCARMFDAPQDWSAAAGLSFALQSASPGALLHVDLYAGPPEGRETYVVSLEVPGDAGAWSVMTAAWQDFKRVDWEENAGTAFSSPGQVTGLAFGFPGGGGSGSLWVDALGAGTPSTGQAPPQPTRPAVQAPTQAAESPPTAQPPGQPGAETGNSAQNRLFVCGEALAFPLALVAGLRALRLRRK